MTGTRSVVLVLVAAMVVAPVAAVATGSAASDAPDEDATPGEKLSGVVAVQGSELDGEMRERTFGARVASAETDAAKAAVVADELDDLEQRLSELEQRKQELQEARENGEISEGTYRAEMAKVAAEIENARRMANHSERVAGDLPAELLAEKNIDVESIRTLKNRAANLTGPEVAEIARSIAGENVGRSIAGETRPEEIPGIGNRSDGPGAGGPPEDGPPGDDADRGEGTPGDEAPDVPGTDGDDASVDRASSRSLGGLP